MTVVFVSSLGSTAPFSRTSSLSQHTGVLVMDQEERHALLSNVQMTNWALSEEHFRQASTWKTTEHNARYKVAHGDVNAHHALEFGQTMVKWLRKS